MGGTKRDAGLQTHWGVAFLGHTHKHVLLGSPECPGRKNRGLGYKNEGRRDSLVARVGERCCNCGAAGRAAAGGGGGGGSTRDGGAGANAAYLGLRNQQHRHCFCEKGNGEENASIINTRNRNRFMVLNRPGRGWGQG